MATANSNARVQRHRDGLRKAGLCPIQIWAPDTRLPGFAEKCRRQVHLVTDADSTDVNMPTFIEEALQDIEGWTE